jgi:hypothetical protein
MRILDRGPIPLAELDRYDDPDIETSLEHGGHSSSTAVFRLIEIDLSELEDTASFPLPWRPTRTLEALRRGETLPPVVVVETDRDRGLGLIDGLNRTYAHWIAGKTTLGAYELLLGGRS